MFIASTKKCSTACDAFAGPQRDPKKKKIKKGLCGRIYFKMEYKKVGKRWAIKNKGDSLVKNIL